MLWLIFLVHVLSFWVSALFALYRAPRDESSLTCKEILPLVLLNQFVVMPLLIWMVEWIMGPLMPISMSTPMSITVSNLGHIIWELLISPFQYALMLFILNVGFALAHYGFHRIRWLYHNIHSVHHRLKVPHPIGAIYAHPLEHIIANLAPVGLAISLVRPNPLLGLIFIGHISYDTVQSHTSFLNRDLASNHNLHHSKVTCNYDNSPYLFDRLIGTYRAFARE